MARILIVEDDPWFRRELKDILSLDRHSVDAVETGEDAISFALSISYDLIILDINLPDSCGFDICAELRSRNRTARVLMVSGRSSVVDKVAGFGSGADDYLTKPFDASELRCRVHALIRRPDQLQPNTITVGKLKVDVAKWRVEYNGETVELQPLEFKLLRFLMEHKDQPFTVESLLSRVWPAEDSVGDNTVRQCITRLRKKFDPADPEAVIQNIRGVGYVIRDHATTTIPAEAS